MQVEKLTDNGVEKLLGGVSGVVLQVLGACIRHSSNQEYYKCDLSDGFSKYKGCLIVDAEILSQKDAVKDFIVIKVSKSFLQQSKAQQPVAFIEKCAIIYEQLSGQIGEPIIYQQFVKNGKQNPRGNNLLKSAKPSLPSLPRKIYQNLIEESKQDDNRQAESQMNNKKRNNSIENQNRGEKKPINPNIQSKQSNNNSKIGNRNGNLRLSNQQDENYRQQNSLNARQNSNSNNTGYKTNQKNNQNSRQISINQSSRREASPKAKNSLLQQQRQKGPIQKIPEKKQMAVKGNPKRQANEYNLIKDLFMGIQNWTIQGRILFVYPAKTFINKKGVESSILKIQIGDMSGTIQCTLFGQMAQLFDEKFKQDQVYEISNGIVAQSNYMGKHELKITITQNTLVRLKEDDNVDLPYTEDLWISVKELIEVPVGQTKTVICLVKDSGNIMNLVSKAGKELRKKSIFLCDPQSKVEVEATIWNDRCEQTFQLQPYIIKNVQIGEYNSNRQYTLKTNFIAKIAKQHKYRRYIKDLENIAFANPDSDKKQNRTTISNFKDLVNAMDEVKSSGVWSEVVCTVNTIKSSTKNYYLSCPSCKKKVIDQTNGECVNCHATYEQAKPKYILNVMLIDMYESVWTTLYDETAEQLTGMSATEFARLNEEGLQDLLRKVRYKEIKLKMLTKNEEFNKEMRKKTGAIKFLKLDYAAQTKSMLSRLKFLMNN